MNEIVATAPGRCGLIGTPTDMYGGSVVSCTTQERAECRLIYGGDGDRIKNGETSHSDRKGVVLLNLGAQAILQTKEDLALKGDVLDISRAALTHFQIDPAQHDFTLTLRTEIPMRAGLSGSTAMLAAIVGALDAYLAFGMDPYTLAETTRKIEARIMKVVCGFQDQHMAVFGGLNFMDFLGKESLEQREEEPFATIEPLAHLIPDPPLLLAHTGVQHHSGNVHQSPRERWLAGEPLVRRNFARIAQLARPGKKALIARDWKTLGALMNENHALVAELGGSGPDNERLIEAARRAGAFGAKLAGAGGGGTILALTDDSERVSAHLMEAHADRLLTPAPSPGLQVSQGGDERVSK